MHTSDDDSKAQRSGKYGEPLLADGSSDIPQGENVGASAGGVRKQRGPYRVADVSIGDRNADLLRDPEVAAFLDALNRICDPRQRALVEGLVREFAGQKKAHGA